MVSLTVAVIGRGASTGTCLSKKRLGLTARALLVASAFFQLVAFSLAASHFTDTRMRRRHFGKALKAL